MGSDAAEFVEQSQRPSAKSDRKESRTLRSQVKSIQQYGECSRLQREMRRHSWERISQLFKVSVMNSEDLTLKQMFDVTAQLVNNQEEICGLDKIQWEKDSWTRLSLIGDETVINLQSTKVYVFSDSVLCLGKFL